MGKILTGSTDQTLAAANCLAGDLVGNLVYVSGPDVGGLIQVTTIDITDQTKMPAIGIVLAKSSPTTCTVLLWGIFIVGSALTPNATYFASATGGISTAVPAPRPSFLQPVGHALDAVRLFLKPSLVRTKLTT